MKKIIYCLSICLIIVASLFSFSACNEMPDKERSYYSLSKLMTEISEKNTENNMFGTGTVDGVQSDYILDYYRANATYKYFVKALVIPMNFINNYYQDLERIKDIDNLSKEKQDTLNNLSSSVSDLKCAYENSVDKYDKLKEVSGSDLLVEGAEKVFNSTFKDLFNSSYCVAMNLAKVKDFVFNDYAKLIETNRALTTDDTKQLLDYFTLEIAQDYFNCLFVNLNMETLFDADLSNNNIKDFVIEINSIKTNFSDMARNIGSVQTNQLKELTGEKITHTVGEEVVVLNYKNSIVEKLLRLRDTMNKERSALNNALAGFNLYDFYKNECDKTKYIGESKIANKYYNEIFAYYKEYLVDYANYLQQIMIGE